MNLYIDRCIYIYVYVYIYIYIYVLANDFRVVAVTVAILVVASVLYAYILC
jgi:hypothetical protein